LPRLEAEERVERARRDFDARIVPPIVKVPPGALDPFLRFQPGQ